MSECMTQEDAERMDEKQAIQILKPLMAMMRDQNGCPISAAYFAIGKAINALEEQDKIVRCKDCKFSQEEGHWRYCKFDRHDGIELDSNWFCADGEVATVKNEVS